MGDGDRRDGIGHDGWRPGDGGTVVTAVVTVTMMTVTRTETTVTAWKAPPRQPHPVTTTDQTVTSVVTVTVVTVQVVTETVVTVSGGRGWQAVEVGEGGGGCREYSGVPSTAE